MRFKIFTTLVFLTMSVFFLSENITAQKLRSGGKPIETKVDGFDRSFCVNLSGKFRVCKTADYDAEETKFIVQKNNETLAITDAPFYSLACCEMKDFFAFRGDLDKDGSEEIIIAALEGISNGMGISSYNVHIFRDPTKFSDEKPLTFPLEEFGEKGNFIFDAKRNETQILVTYWSGFDNLDRKRISGTYLTGKWFRYQKGLLEPVLEKPTLARRFLYSFGREMGRTQGNPHTPYLWLKSKNTHRFFAEPKEISKLIETQYGTIRNYEEVNGIEERRLFIQTDSGKLVKGIYAYNSFHDKKEADTFYVTDIGLEKVKFIFPFDFHPSIYSQKIEGKRVKLETYQDKYDNKYTKLWILDR